MKSSMPISRSTIAALLAKKLLFLPLRVEEIRQNLHRGRALFSSQLRSNDSNRVTAELLGSRTLIMSSQWPKHYGQEKLSNHLIVCFPRASKEDDSEPAALNESILLSALDAASDVYPLPDRLTEFFKREIFQPAGDPDSAKLFASAEIDLRKADCLCFPKMKLMEEVQAELALPLVRRANCRWADGESLATSLSHQARCQHPGCLRCSLKLKPFIFLVPETLADETEAAL